MHRFIASKGRTLQASAHHPGSQQQQQRVIGASASGTGGGMPLARFASHQNLCFSSSSGDYLQSAAAAASADASTGFPASGRRTGSPAGGLPRKKGSVSAESKIQEEMREMRAREQELK